MAKRRGMMPMAGADGVGMTPRGMRNRHTSDRSERRRTRLNAERRIEERARHAEAEAQEKKKEEAAKEAKRKAAAMGGQKTSSMMSLAKKPIPARFLKVQSAKEKEEEEEGEDEPSPSGLPAEEKLEILLYIWKNFFWN